MRAPTSDSGITHGTEPTTDRRQAERFLRLLDPGATSFTFQTFDDNKERHDKRLARVLHGTLADLWGQLASLNARGAGIFVTVNETDGQGRRIENVERIRAAFVDLDGSPLEPVSQSDLPPHLEIESSPGRWQAYWLSAIGGIKREQFSDLQKRLAERFAGDDAVHDLPRVMRLPGFLHCKGQPYPVRIVATTVARAVTAEHFGDDINQSTVDEDAGRGTATRRQAPGRSSTTRPLLTSQRGCRSCSLPPSRIVMATASRRPTSVATWKRTFR
jgi:RepB DNA-primase from phage plasmid